jgi:outer membrane protein TolC
MYRIIVIVCCLTVCAILNLEAQSQKVSFEEAIEIALKNDPSIVRDQLASLQYEKLQGAGIAPQKTQIFLSGDEFNLNGISGVQSINIQQNFNLPGVSKSYNGYYKAQLKKSEKQLILTKNEIRKNVELAYYSVLFAKRKVIVLTEAEIIYREFLEKTSALLKSGEAGKIPQSSANILVSKSKMELDHAIHEAEVALNQLNIWLGGHTTFDTANDLPESTIDIVMTQSDNSYIKVLEAEKDIAVHNVNIRKASLLPQINAGARLQSVNGSVLFFGYQAGINIPLSRNSQNKKIDAALIAVERSSAAIESRKKEVNLKVTQIQSHSNYLLVKIQYLDDELLPAILNQKILLEEAYTAGEGNYFEYVMALENYSKHRLMKVNLMEEYYIYLSELKFWSGTN